MRFHALACDYDGTLAHDSHVSEEALGAGAWHVVAKPVELPTLLDLVGRAYGQPQVLVGIPGAGPGLIPLAAGGTEAVSGDMTLDGNTLWVGVAGTNTVHRINLGNSTDDLQIQLNLNGTNAVPDIVAVRPK